jgi:hypothetical protein
MKKSTGILVPHTLRKKEDRFLLHGGSSIGQQSRKKEDAKSFPVRLLSRDQY